MPGATSNSTDPVVLAKRLATGNTFTALFREGMALVEATAAYLDGPGRVEAKDLDRPAALNYATESMRLTTRLMQLASWLLLQRAVNEGEQTFEQPRTEKMTVKLTPFPKHEPDVVNSLPAKLVALIGDSRRLHDHVLRLDALVYGTPAEPEAAPSSNPVETQLGLLKAAFGRQR
jgi:regulator of CtrA degradation